LDTSPRNERNTSPPESMSTVRTTSWPSENTSISAADMLETVAADTAVNNMSMPRGLRLGARTVSAARSPHPAQDVVAK